MPAALTLALAGALALGAHTADVLLLLAVLAVQGLLIFGWHRALDVPGALGGMILSAATALAADVALLVRDDARPLTPVTGVLGVAMLGALVHQLTRRPDRARLTASLTATTMLVVLVALGALYLPAEETRGEAALVALVAAATVAAAGAELLPSTAVVRGAVAVVVGLAVGAVFGGVTGLAMGSALLAGGAAAAVAAAAMAFVRRAERPDLATSAALPLVVAGPVAYVLGRILVG